ncbi:MAG TPA: large-conductance mechanosensitive channel protein MscL [Cyclobacteriaceae bacterium]|nr:large-conductance mechanosensitive channel protein MscL [Cyclobacteriaceae bacterium]
MKMFDEFKKFAMRGNVVDLAVGIIIGGAFGKIVSSIVNDIIMPPIGLLVGGVNFTDLKLQMRAPVLDEGGNIVKAAVTLNYGNFIQTTVDFLIIAFAVFMVVKLMNQLMKKSEVAPPAPQPTPSEKLLGEIRDLLKK